MFSERRGRRAEQAAASVESHRISNCLVSSNPRMIDRADECLTRGGAECLAHTANERGGNRVLSAAGHPTRRRGHAKFFFQNSAHHAAMLHALRIAREARIMGKLRPAENARAEEAEVAIGSGSDDEG